MSVSTSAEVLNSQTDSAHPHSALLDSSLRLDPMVSLRPEPFGALAYHFGTRRLSFLRSPDIVAVVKRLDASVSVTEALRSCAIAQPRWPSFLAAIATLIESGMLLPVSDDPPAAAPETTAAQKDLTS